MPVGPGLSIVPASKFNLTNPFGVGCQVARSWTLGEEENAISYHFLMIAPIGGPLKDGQGIPIPRLRI